MAELLGWLTKYSPAVVLAIAFGAGLLYVIRLVLEKGIASYVDEKLRAVKYQRYSNYARGILSRDGNQNSSADFKHIYFAARDYFFERDEIKQATKALGVLTELARNYPYRTQEIIDEICLFVRKKWNKRQDAVGKDWSSVLALALRILAGFPKKDQNQYPFYIELSGLRVQNIDLKGINFENFVLWETEFIGVNMTRSNFRNTDLGGCVFAQGTSVEWSDFSGALMNVAFNGVVTTFDRALLWGSKFEESRIDRCRMIISDGFDMTNIKAKFGDRLEAH